MNKIGIRHEDKYLLERRVALAPKHVKELITHHGIEVYVQRSGKRVFGDDEYESVGATLVDSFPEDVDTIIGVKEMPNDFFRKSNTNIFFSHTIKGQEYNMGMLRKMMEKKINLFDYERITDEHKRLIFFGRFAGLAGAINSLWSLGRRYDLQGISSPFNKLKQAHTYSSLQEAIEIIKEISVEIKSNGLHPSISPIVIGLTGYGNVSHGAQEIIDLLPVKEISAEELLSADLSDFDSKVILKVVFREEDLSEHNEGNSFDLKHYYAHPEQYNNKFEAYIPKLSLLLNCMYWDPRYPRIITKDFLHELWKRGDKKLTVIGDITCDPNGSIECTHTGTPIVNPVYIYNPTTRHFNFGFTGEGILIMAVEILPSELPRESSIAFGEVLTPFAAAIAKTDFSVEFDELNLPAEIKRALILHKGELTPDYKYLNEYLISTNQ